MRNAESRIAKSIYGFVAAILAIVVGSLAFVASSPAATSAPTIEGAFTAAVTASTADLHAAINPNGDETTYHFEYGKSVAYGGHTPDAVIPAGSEGVNEVAHLTGLDGGVYHFRVVATNGSGTTSSADQTFSFYPPSCPNEHLRQQTGASYLPDCRAYELVSPANSGNALLRPSGPFSPTATSPSRFSFGGELGLIPGAGPAQAESQDLYVATRHDDGWRTKYVGIPSNLHADSGGPPTDGIGSAEGVQTDLEMNRFLDWNPGTQGSSDVHQWGEFAGYLWDAEGNALGRWPTNADEVPGGLEEWTKGGFYGDALPSADFSHYFFSSANVAFAQGGLTSGSGSAYDDDVETGTVSLISVLPGGGNVPIPQASGDNTNDDFLRLPAASNDGSHVVIEAPHSGVCGLSECPPSPYICNTTEGGFLHSCPGPLPSHLYMRVNDAVTYDISGNHSVVFRGMTPDGRTVFFTSEEQVTADDHDSSTDLFMWSENNGSPTIARISTGEGGTGNTDSCAASWIGGCGVEVAKGLCRCNLGSLTEIIPARGDNNIAADTGEIYFLSPEQLETGKGVQGDRNLYVYREGHPRFVAALPDSTTINRIEVSPDGQHAAFVTAARLTSYDNSSPSGICTPGNPINGAPASGPLCRELYSYEPATGSIECDSCVPDGERPESDVETSVNGKFMTDDGRTFFTTEEKLVPRDSDGLLDVYEFIENRPQLISSGTSAADRSKTELVSLVGVSANGTDAYFSTLDTLVGQDKNGQFFKFYDARTNGGFPFVPPAAPCAAADECHGPGTSAPPEIAMGTGQALGNGGNNHQAGKRRKKHGEHKKKHGERRHRQLRDRHGTRG